MNISATSFVAHSDDLLQPCMTIHGPSAGDVADYYKRLQKAVGQDVAMHLTGIWLAKQLEASTALAMQHEAKIDVFPKPSREDIEHLARSVPYRSNLDKT